MSSDQKICFVVMGFGKKTDFESGRTLDLDATYEAIIQPAVASSNLRCIRANEVLHSGVIDVKMYEMLLRADLVIADISTGNVNAVYELGVRHALRPFSTIIMKEKEGRLHFDLNHVNTFIYEHMGDDIGNREAKRAEADLTKLIHETIENSSPDSPVYTYIPNLKEPQLTDEEYEELLEKAEETQEHFSKLLSDAEEAAEDSRHQDAAKLFNSALAMSSDNPYLRQQTALHTYKAEFPSQWIALVEASKILEPLNPIHSNDPETLGISGAIYKRMWLLNEDQATLDLAIQFYERGFDVRGDYYNGENAATCLEIRSKIQTDKAEAQYDQMSAGKIRKSVIENLLELVEKPDFTERSDQLWIFATLANCNFAIGNKTEAEMFEKKFHNKNPVEWQKKTYEAGKQTVIEYFKNLES